MAEGISLDQFMTLPAKTAPAKGISIDDFMKLPARIKEEDKGSFLPELGKGIVGGAISSAGTALKGQAAADQAARQDRSEYWLAADRYFSRIDAGKEPGKITDPDLPGLIELYQGSTPEQRAQLREAAQAAAKIHPVEDVTQTPLFKAGAATQEFAAKNFAAAKDYQNSITRQFGEALGSMATMAGTGLVSRGMGVLSGVQMSVGEQVDMALQKGASKGDVLNAANLAFFPGATEYAPLEVMFSKIPAGKWGKFADALVKVGEGFVTEGGQEGLQQFMQNKIAGFTYNPKQDPYENVASSALIGGAVGGTVAGLALPLTLRGEEAAPRPEGEPRPPYEPPPAEQPAATQPTAPPPAAPPAGVPEGALPADTILPPEEPAEPAPTITPPKVERLTPADRTSPIPDDIIDHGKSLVEEATGKPSTITTTEAVGNQRRVVETPVAEIVARDRAQTAALISRVTAGIDQPIIPELGQQAAPPAGGTLGDSVPIPATAEAAVAPSTGDRRLDAGIGAAGDIAQIASQVQAEQSAWLADRGLTMEQARALPPDQQAKLQADYQASRQATSGDNTRQGATAREYPTAPRDEWYSDADYQARGGKITMMSPDEFLSRAKPLDVDESSRDNIDDLKRHIESGRKLDPLKLYGDGGEDGRHRAIAARELGITQVPVVEFPAGAKVGEDSTSTAVGTGVKDVSDAAHPASEDTSSFAEFVAKSKAHMAAREAKARELAAETKSVRMESQKDPNRRALVGPDMSADDKGKFRVTYFHKGEPSGHVVYNTYLEGVENALREGFTPVQQTDAEKTLRAKIDAKREAGIPKKIVSTDNAITASGREVPVAYAVVEADDLIASQRDEGGTNPDYPQELQPRDRSRGSSDQQINKIAQNLDPRLLDKNPNASDGAPIISADGVVESGNGRVLAVRRAYGQGMPTAEAYRKYLADQGYPVEGMKSPVLVRVRQGSLKPEDRAAFTREANERTTLAMSATERAMADATAMKPETVGLYRGGEIGDAGNRDFVKSFMQGVVNPNEQAAMVTPDGTLSQEAVRRVQGALLAKAYGDADLVGSLIESPDNNIKAIGGAMMDTAGLWSQKRTEAKEGTISPDADITDRVLEAVRLVQRARNEGRPLAEYVSQKDIFSGETIHPQAEAVLRLMFRNDASWTQPVGREKLAEALRFYATEARKTTAGVDLLGEKAPAPGQILQKAKERQYGTEETQARLALGNRTAGPDAGAYGGKRAVEAKSGPQAASRPAVPRKDEAPAPAELSPQEAMQAAIRADGERRAAAAAKKPEPAKQKALKAKIAAKREAAKAEPRQGEVGMKLAAGEVVRTATGRETTPFPKISADTERKTAATVKRVDAWLMQNALAEAQARGDEFNARQFAGNQTKPSPADKDNAAFYLFDSGSVLPAERPITRPFAPKAEPRHELSDERVPTEEELLHSEGPQVLAPGTVHKKIGSLREKYERFEKVKLRAKILTEKVQALIARMNAIPRTDLEDGTGPYKEFGKFSPDPNAPWWKNRLSVYNFGTKENPVRAKDIDELHARMEDRANRLAIDDVNKVRKQDGLPPLPHYTPEIGHHAVVVIGLPGSGKSTISNNAAIENQAAVVDIDNAKEIIPEYYDPKTGRGGIGANAVHQESGELNWETLQRMMRKGVNMVIPRVGQSPGAIEELRWMLEKAGYTIELQYMDVTPTTAADRMLGRAEETERLINPEWFLSIIREPGRSYEALKKSGKFDGYSKIRSDNIPTTPTSVTEALGPEASFGVGDIIERNGTTRRVGPPQRGSNAARTQDVRGKREGLKAWEPAPLKLTEAQRLEDIEIDNELLDDPKVAEAEEKIEKLASTADEKGYDTPEWWGKRLYNFGTQKLGVFEAIQRFISGARRLATNEINQGRAKLGLAPLPHYQVANNREAVILMGVTGAGKSSIANPIAYRMKAAIPDVDEYKKAIPGYDDGLGATAVHPESHQLGLRVLEQLLDEGANVVIQTVGDAHEKIEGHRRRLVSKGYTVHLAVMDPPPRTALQRMVARFKRTGRLIPRSVFMRILRQPPHIYKHAKKLGRFDSYARVYSDNVSLSRVTEATAGVSPVAAGETFNQDGTIGSARNGGRSGEAQRGQSGSQEIGNRPEGGQRRDELSTHVEPIKGGQAVYRLRPEYQAKAAAVLRDLQAEINRLAPGVPVRVWETIRNLINGKDIAVTGQYLNGVIDVALASKDPELTLYHEVVHALWDTFTPAEQAILTRKSNREWRERYDIARKYGTATEEIQIEEGVAAAITDWKRGARMDGVVAKAFKRIMAILRALGSAFTKNGIRSAEDVFADIESGKIGQRLAQQQTYRKLHPLEVRAEVTRKIPDARPLPANVEARVRQADNETTPALENAIREFTLWSRDGERLNEGKMAEHVRNGFGELEEAARGNNLALAAEIEQNFAPVREFMRKQFGDTVKLYRKQRQVAAGKSRAMLSWSYDPAYAWQHMPAHKEGAVQEFVVHAADVPLEHIVWATNRGGEVEFILHNDPKNEVSVDTTGKLVVKPKPTTETVNMFEGPREQFVIPGAEKISQKSLFQRQAEMKMQPKKGQKSVGDLPLFSDQKDQMSLFEIGEGPPNESAPRFELNAAPHGNQQATQVMQGFLQRGQPIDRAVRVIFDLLGGLDEKNHWRPSKRLGDKLGITPQRREAASVGGIMGAMVGGMVAGPVGVLPGAAVGGTVGTFLLGSAAWPTTGAFSWFRGFAENAKRGLISNYGLDPEYVEAYRKSNLGKAEIARRAEGIMKVLSNAGVGTTEAKVLHSILTGEAVNDADMVKLAEPIRNAIDALGAEMVSEGLISAESFERNRGAYLHRVYLKHEADTDNLSNWVAKKMANRRMKILGDELKGRGIFMDVENARLMRDVDSFKSAARGGPVKGEKFRVIDEVSRPADLLGAQPKEKVLRRVYLPTNEAVPAKYQGPTWVNRGTWEARQVGNGKTTLWRDYTKEERGNMGEIVDARYGIAKTFMLAANDIATGKFFRQVAEKEEWARSMQPPDGTWKEGGEYNIKNGRLWEDPNIQWVKVPDGNIPKTNTKRWGALAGKFVRAEIWRDLNEINLQQSSTTWRVLMAQWKKNKTGRNPVVHLNNVMSNLVWMDLADVRAQDLYRGIKAYFSGNADYIEARDNGAFGSDMVAQDLRQNVLKPILDEISQQSTKATQNPLLDWTGIPFLQRAKLVGVLADKLWSWAKWADNGMLRAYQAEDEIFRMAAYLRRRSQGEGADVAGKNARDQFMDYDIRAPWVVAAKNSVLPFISYTYRAVPKLMENIQNRPWKLIKYVTLAAAANSLAYLLDDGDDDDDKKRGKLLNREQIERAGLRDEEQGYTWLGVPRMARMPYRDSNGLPVFLDIRRWIPAGDVFDMEQGNAALPIPAPLLFGGPLQIAMELRMNRSAFTGEDITNSLTQTPLEKASAAADYAWKAWAPNSFWSPSSWYWTKIANAYHGAQDPGGNVYSLPQALMSAVGVKVKSVDVENGIMWHYRDFKAVQDALKSELRAAARQLDRGIMSQSAFDKQAAGIMRKFENLGAKVEDLGQRTKPQREPVK